MVMGFCSMRRMVPFVMLMVVFSTVHGQPVQPSSSDMYCPTDHLESQFASIEDRLVDIQKMVSTLSNPLMKEDCTVDLASYGYNDSTIHGYVKTSGGSSEDFLVQDELRRYRHVNRGVTLIELDPKRCTTRNRQRFDTSAYVDGTVLFMESLQFKTTGTIIVGVTADTAENGEMAFQKSAGSFFTSYNMNLSGLRNRDKFAFIMQKGYPNKTVFQMKRGGGESIKMKIVVRGSTIDDVTFNRV